MIKLIKITKALFRVIHFCWSYSQKIVGSQIWLLSFYNVYINIHPLINAYFLKLIIDSLTRVNELGANRVGQYVGLIVLLHFLVDSWDQFVFRHKLVISRTLRQKLLSAIEIDLAYKHASLPVKTVEDSEFKDQYVLVKRESGFRIYPIVDEAVGLISSVISLVIAALVITRFSPLYLLILLGIQIPRLFLLKPAINKSVEASAKEAKYSRIRGIYLYFLESGRSTCESRILQVKDFIKKRLLKIHKATVGIFEKTQNDLLWGKITTAIIPMAGVFSISYLLLREVIKGLVTIGNWQLVLNISLKFVDQSKSAIDNLGQLHEASVYIDKLLEVLNKKEEVAKGKKADFAKINSIEFKNVSFAYPNANKPALKDISFKIDSGENIAIVGHNGAGKSTLVKLLCRFYTPNSGQILINGHNLEKLNIVSWWRQISALFQDFESYGISAWESIGYGDTKRINQKKAIRQAARLTGIDKHLAGLESGYDTPLIQELEGGVNLSIGQWQKVALARSLFKRSKMIILDEPTSNIDPESEEKIFNKLMRIVKNRVMFLISHRFSTVKRADRILVIESGQLVEEGSHQELMKENGLYAKLFRIQSESYKE
ncbi:MAG: ABC transporter ATP-binding protein [Candidatus Pacebacteria bacterium]|nr:ABC transporter ATP-binding protein [Candidatus Paceibacterota bacterium]